MGVGESGIVTSHSENIELHGGIYSLVVVMEIFPMGPAGGRYFEWVAWWIAVGSRDFSK